MLYEVIKRYPSPQLCVLSVSNTFFRWEQNVVSWWFCIFLTDSYRPLPGRLVSWRRWGGAGPCVRITATNRKHFMLSIHSDLRRERTWGPGQEPLCTRKRKLTWLLVILVHCTRCGKQAAVKYVGYSAGIDWLLNDWMSKLCGFTNNKVLIIKCKIK